MKDRAKTFMYISISIMALCLAIHFEPQESQADINPTGYIFGISGQYVLTISGHVYSANFPDPWTREEGIDPPVPLNEIAMWDGKSFLATNGDFWRYDQYNGEWFWTNHGLPVDPTAVGEIDIEAQEMRTAGGCAPGLF